MISRYELGIDTFPAKSWGANPEQIAANEAKAGKEVFPAHEEYGRHTDGTSEFTVSLVPENRGVLLRRTLDYSFPNQSAEVFVSADDGKSWQSAGIWYLAGSNTFYHSYPKDEPGTRTPNVLTSNRRFRDDEFLLPEVVTRGHDKIRVRIRTIENKQELLPGVPFPKPSHWSELKYEAYCYVLPVFDSSAR
jgi:hypothetical protein